MPQEPGCDSIGDPVDDATGPTLNVVNGCPPFCINAYTCVGALRKEIDWEGASLYFNMYFTGIAIDPITGLEFGSDPEIARATVRLPVGFERVRPGDVVSSLPRDGELMIVEEVWDDRTVVFVRGAYGTQPADKPANTTMMFFRVFQGEMAVEAGTGKACYNWQPDDIAVPGKYVGYVDVLSGDVRFRLPLKGSGYPINIVPAPVA